MSTKPTAFAEHDTNLTHVTATPAGVKSDGFGVGEVIPSDTENYWRNLVGRWTQYLKDGDFTGGATVTGGLQADTYKGAAGAIASAPAGLTATVLKYTVAVARVTVAPCVEPAGALHTKAIGNFNIYAASGNPVYFPLDGLQVGDVFSCSLDFAKNTNNGCTNTWDIVQFIAGVESSATGAPASNNGNAVGSIVYAAGPVTVAAGKLYYFKLTPGNSVTPAADRSYALTISSTRP